MSEEKKSIRERVIAKAKSIIAILNEKRPRMDKHRHLKNQITDLKDDLNLYKAATGELEEFRIKSNEVNLKLEELQHLEDALETYKENYHNAIEQLTNEIEKKVFAEQSMKKMEIEKLALEELCYKKTEEVITATKELEMTKKDLEIKESLWGKEKGDYIG